VGRLEVHAEQVLTSRPAVWNLAREVQSAAARKIWHREDGERREPRSIDPVRGNPAEDTAVLEAPACVGGAARQAGAEILDVRERVAAAVHALREIAAPLECGRHARLTHGRRIAAALEFLAPEKEHLSLVGVEPP